MADLDAVFAKHHGNLFRFLSRLSGDPELAKDAVQDTFLRFAKRPPDNGVPLEVWLYRVGATVARDAIRMRKRRQSLLRDSVHRVPHASEGLDPSAAVGHIVDRFTPFTLQFSERAAAADRLAELG